MVPRFPSIPNAPRLLAPLLLWLLALLCLLACAPAAQAESIVHTKDGNVWVANPDGGGQYQVTLDGTAELPYYAPTQAADGTIVALHRVIDGSRRPSEVVRMRQNGSLLNAPFKTNSPFGGVTSAALSPDGVKVGYTFAVAGNVQWRDLDGNLWIYHDTTTLTDFTAADRLAGVGFNGSDETAHRQLSWMGPSRALLINQQNLRLDYVDQGGVPPAAWFDFCDVYPDPSVDECAGSPVEGGGNTHDHGMILGAAVNPQGDRLATINGLLADETTEWDYRKRVLFYAGGTPPAAPTPMCATGVDPAITAANSDDRTVVSWSPDGRSVAFDWSDGIHVAQLPTLANDCEGNHEGLILPGASSPSWGPAPVNPGPRGSKGSPGGDAPRGGTGKPRPTAPGVRAGLPRNLHLRKVARSRRLPVVCVIKGPGRCTVKVTIAAAAARKLRLKIGRRARILVVGQASHRFKRAGKAVLKAETGRQDGTGAGQGQAAAPHDHGQGKRPQSHPQNQNSPKDGQALNHLKPLTDAIHANAIRTGLTTAVITAAITVALFVTAAIPAWAAKQTHFAYVVVKATHSSSSTGHDASMPAEAHSRSSWKLVKATRKATNRLSVDYTPVGVVGGGMLNLRGVYRADATVVNGPTVCKDSLVAPTGNREYALLAPGADQLSVMGGRQGLKVVLGILGGGARIATSPYSGGYFDSACGNSWHFDSDDVARANSKTVPFNTFRRKRIVLRFKGGHHSVDTTTSWNTTIVLKRVDKKR